MFVKDIVKGSPAEEAGLKYLDHILEINGVSVENKSKAQIAELFNTKEKVNILVVSYEKTHKTSGQN